MSGIVEAELQGRDVAAKDGVVEESGVAQKIPLQEVYMGMFDSHNFLC